MGADALSDVLRAVRLSSAMFFHLDVRAPWVAEAPESAACASAVLPGAQHVIEYHVVVDGRCWGGLIDAPSVRLEAGDIIAFPQGSAHVLSSAPGMRSMPDLSIYGQARASQLPLMMRLGDNGPADARILCGFLGCDTRPFNPLVEALPPVLHLRGSSYRENSGLGYLINAARVESEGRRTGGEGVLARLGELLFVEAIRCHIEALGPEQTGWFAGLADRHVGQALNLLHGEPAADWTLDELAKAVGLSRSTFAQRFTHLIGQPPMQYLTRWRMQLAAGLLASGSDPIARVAEAVGYDSEAAFNRAFRRTVGTPPAAWRQTQISPE
ncbi:AraC family transcriptional regulator [Bradyrhizobium sp. 157]|jgi:AraC-like DNA-binding protein|uniref:AraC family transcriptional regulator n=1 Tax=Bradyrhizobium sp. 157 TaxID=2782631 RepID=UPI001FF7612E|nr:AraC family transcriptional regulator [Bradyrhizobium sp. 157]MCK1640873.1 AraC family transcriptional regulator [Bradyrhizobium sp. 157]